jgi:hypothetical protein
MNKILPLSALVIGCVAATPLSASARMPSFPNSQLPRFVFTDVAGKKSSVEVVQKYQPNKITWPFGKTNRQIDPKLMRAATIAEERAHAHSRRQCWHAVKEALVASGAINSRPKTILAKQAAQELVSNYGFKRLAISDPYQAPVGSVLVYDARRAAGHIEIRTADGFVSDFHSKTPSRRPLLGVFVKS